MFHLKAELMDDDKRIRVSSKLEIEAAFENVFAIGDCNNFPQVFQ